MTARNLRVWMRGRNDPLELNVPSPRIVHDFERFLLGGSNALYEESPPSFHLAFDPCEVIAMQFGSLDGDESPFVRQACFFLKGRNHPLDVLVYSPDKVIAAYQNYLTSSKDRPALDHLEAGADGYFTFCIDLAEVSALMIHAPGKQPVA